MATRQPLRYEITAGRQPGSAFAIEAGARPPIAGGPPPEFGGTAEVWSPEHLFVSSVALCFLATLDWYAARRNVAVVACQVRAEGTVEMGERGLSFTAVRLEAVATARPGQSEPVRQLMETAKKSCLVANSLRCPVELIAEVREEVEATAPASARTGPEIRATSRS